MSVELFLVIGLGFETSKIRVQKHLVKHVHLINGWVW